MSEREHMERPVTYRELKQEITRIDEQFAGIDRVLHTIVERLVAFEQRMTVELKALNERITTEAKAAIEWGVAQIRSYDDKYRDLPPRVAKLEAKVFPPRRARRR